ncbi:distal tail protein [Lactococcus phage 936 group phage PhiL.6]|uniref:Distal tail protein n=1 Tax=Lactococcus phage 936 group phage PhiL.6 TaxID=1636582 RepID=A0A126HBV6_9CAUD|nr:tail protein [Lactococcus phage 936 group phage PhiL.6]ALM64074.1 distal tail protein [Lactococcus phage 936 group phage PhiL.6]
MVRQYKIHTNLDGTGDKVWDVTNGKVRFYQPSNLGLQSTNNIWQRDGIGVMGTRSITQPQIEFKLETFGESLEENYRLMKDFINDILNQKFVTLEYQTEIFQVYADLALADVTKTEGYGKNGTFSEKITFDIITKWYTYENLTFDMVQNGKVIAGKSKIYGGYKGNETPLQNYNRLKASPSLNLPNLNLLSLSSVKIGQYLNWSNGLDLLGNAKRAVFDYIQVVPNQTYTLSSSWNGWYISVFGYSDKTSSAKYILTSGKMQPITGSGFSESQDVTFTVPADCNYLRVHIGNDIINTSASDIKTVKAKIEAGSTATPYMQSASEVTTNDISEYFGYNYIANQAYTYYGETNIDGLSRWDIEDEIFSFMGILYPKLPKTPAGVRFLDDIGNEYTAIVFKTEQVQDYILINTDVNDETYQGWKGTTALNLFPVMDFERYRTRIIEKGQMELINLSKAEFKIKRKADFI